MKHYNLQLYGEQDQIFIDRHLLHSRFRLLNPTDKFCTESLFKSRMHVADRGGKNFLTPCAIL